VQALFVEITLACPYIYAGEPDEHDALVQRDTRHRGERAAPRAGD
jgi:hypothetical protein